MPELSAETEAQFGRLRRSRYGVRQQRRARCEPGSRRQQRQIAVRLSAMRGPVRDGEREGGVSGVEAAALLERHSKVDVGGDERRLLMGYQVRACGSIKVLGGQPAITKQVVGLATSAGCAGCRQAGHSVLLEQRLQLGAELRPIGGW